MKRYNEYKDSGVEWIGEIPSHWEVKKLGFGLNVRSSRRVMENQYSDEGIPFYRSKEIVELSKNIEPTTNIFIDKSIYNKLKYSAPKKGDLLITAIGTIGQSWISDGRDFYYKDGNLIQVDNSDKINMEYLQYLTRTSDFNKQIKILSEGSTLVALTIDKLNNMKIIYPSHSEQEQIVSYLDKKTLQIETLISKKEELIETLKASRTKLISETVTKGLEKDVPMKDSGVEWIGEIPKHWSICKVKHMLEEGKDGIRMGPFGSNLKLDEMNPEYEYKVYGQENLIYQDFELGDRFINYQKFSTMKQYEVFDGDILISTMGTVGKIDIFRDKYKKGIIDSHLIRVRVNSKLISPEYIKLLINESKYIKDNLNMQSKGSIMEGLNSTIIKNIVVARPPVSEQISITEYITNKISKIDKLILKIEDQIELLKKAKQKLITEVVTGKIDVTNL